MKFILLAEHQLRCTFTENDLSKYFWSWFAEEPRRKVIEGNILIEAIGNFPVLGYHQMLESMDNQKAIGHYNTPEYLPITTLENWVE